jgi:FtsP/CotA-like multicopper oxidase with cupredoxin domain
VVRDGSGRVVSMTAETPPGGTQEYLFTGLKPGTFLYESGTHQAVQVQMGLYGAMTKDAAAGEDVNANGVLDPSEDVNGNGILDPAEDVNGNTACWTQRT